MNGPLVQIPQVLCTPNSPPYCMC